MVGNAYTTKPGTNGRRFFARGPSATQHVMSGKTATLAPSKQKQNNQSLKLMRGQVAVPIRVGHTSGSGLFRRK